MKIKESLLLCAALGAMLTGCASSPVVSDIRVREGMEGSYVKRVFGEPLRTERDADGSEDWYYNFVAWKGNPDGASSTTVSPGSTDTFVNGGLSITKETSEAPIHVSADGHVTGPIPEGKIKKNF